MSRLDHDAENDVVQRACLLSRNQIGECQVAGTGRTMNQQRAFVTCPHAPYDTIGMLRSMSEASSSISGPA